MKLEVYGKPEHKVQGHQYITITYNPLDERTTVVCNADVVTTGIAAKVLADKFNEVLAGLDFDVAYELSTIVAKV